ncbi:RnfABCDGE type electron transport complex subunit B [Sutterella sp.]|uniref:RnfABCDGE type electron transport complex subunit B n=1 Tax=Sutterella sp. TaxID=1981025 RepID=UPI0026E0B11F|nr:RnfABCDGE type electron transport complex subunit B [Sutterella sp.]MDO5531644.1 RnfABCDGE type electron transport complex subunit B [Sutterella sp.]
MQPISLQANAQAIDDVLPQTECRQCGFDGCAAYAEAIAEGRAPINRCAPGGARGIARLAKVTGQPVIALDPEYGREMPFARARIRAAECIGCSWCARACPTDAIAGAPKHMHAVIESRCTGCSLCAPACPMDCIDFVEAGREWTDEDARLAKRHHEETWARRVKRAAAEDRRLSQRRGAAETEGDAKKRFMADILAMARSGRR